MESSIETKEGLERVLKMKVPAEEVTKLYNKKLSNVSKKARVDGFRPGKVPAKVVEERYGQSIRYEVVDELIRETLFTTLQEKDVRPAGPPSVNDVKAEPNKDLEYEAVFEVYPVIKITELDGVEVEKATADINDKDVDEAIAKLSKQHADWTDVERAAKKDDQVILDFDGHIGDEPITGGKAANIPLIIGSNSMIPGFEDGIKGMKPGDEKDIKVTFPEKYHDAKVAGKEAVFKINVHKVQESKLPEMNDEFLSRFGVKEGGVDKLKENIRKHMTSELESAIKLRNKNEALQKLIELNSFDIPKALVESEMQNMFKQGQQMQPGKDKEEKPLTDELRQIFKEPAEKRVKLGLLLAEAIKQYEIKPDQDNVKKLIENMAGNYENPEEFVKWYYTDRNRVAQVEATSLEDQVVEKLLSGAKIKEKKMTYEEVVSPDV